MLEKYKSLIGYALVLLLGLCIGYYLYSPKPAVPETAAASEAQPDGSTILARAPDASAVAPMKIPTGSKLVRLMQVTTKPKPVSNGSMVDCAPVTVDLALIRQPDSTQRVIAHSLDGELLGGIDIPVETAVVSTPPRWAAGLSYDTVKRAGVWLDRDFGAMRAGIAARQADGGSISAEVRVGIRF